MPSTDRTTLALVAHDGKKADMVAFALSHKDVLQRYELVATRTTGKLLKEKCGLPVQQMLSGPLGGDAQIAAQVAEGKIEAVFFFVDPLTPMPHDVDVKALLRLAIVYDIPMALNRATAEIILQGSEMARGRRNEQTAAA